MRRLIAVLAVFATVAAGGYAYAESQPIDPAISSTDQPPAGGTARREGAGRGPLQQAIHGDLLLQAREGGTREVSFDRGRITSMSEDSITIERPDGQSVSAGITAGTTFNGTPRSELTAGSPVLVVHADGQALRVVSRGARGAGGIRERFRQLGR
ncbi:MAG TPA: hypothetical protein VGL92_11640 [Acidimicrobiia bacterium]|jgi:hypothetical protein